MTIAIALVKLPFRLIGWMFKHPKVLIVLAIGIFAFIGFKACSNAFGKADSNIEIAEYQEIAPSESQAPNVLVTNTRVYYVKDYTLNGDVYTLNKYYIYDKKKWVLQEQPLTIDPEYYGKVRLYERTD